MTIKDVQVHLASDTACKKRLQIAVNIANNFDAYLTAVHIRRSFSLPAEITAPMSEGVLTLHREILDEQEAKCRAMFDASVKHSSVKSRCQLLVGSPSNHLINEALHADLVILGQPDPKDAWSLNDGMVDEIIMSAGRPCLLVPHHFSGDDFGKSPLIAWDRSREASRAVHDALPLLKQAGQATILLVEPEEVDGPFSDFPIADHLARHDIKVEVEVVRGPLKNTGGTILTYAESCNHDLLVMGAYGHSRWREIVLGGVTRTILKEMKAPVLMSH